MPKILSNPTFTQRLSEVDDVTFHSVTADIVTLGISVPAVTLSSLVNCTAVLAIAPTLFVDGKCARFSCTFSVTVTAADTTTSFAAAIAAFPVFTTVSQLTALAQGHAGTTFHLPAENCAAYSVPATNSVAVTFTAQSTETHIVKLDAVYYAP